MNGLLAKARPGDHPAGETVAFRHSKNRVHHCTVHQAELTGVEWNVDVGEAVKKAIKDMGCPSFEGGLALTFGPCPVRDVDALQPTVHHLADDLRRVLEVCVYDDNGVACGVL